MKENSRKGASLSEGNLEGGFLYWGPWRMCKGRLCRGTSLSIGALLGSLERFVYWDF
jgi:hypothetical protein